MMAAALHPIVLWTRCRHSAARWAIGRHAKYESGGEVPWWPEHGVPDGAGSFNCRSSSGDGTFGYQAGTGRLSRIVPLMTDRDCSGRIRHRWQHLGR